MGWDGGGVVVVGRLVASRLDLRWGALGAFCLSEGAGGVMGRRGGDRSMLLLALLFKRRLDGKDSQREATSVIMLCRRRE